MLVYLIMVAITIARIGTICWHRPTFADGVLVGAAYYLAVPLLFVFWEAQIIEENLLAPAYYPFENLRTTGALFLGWLTIIVAHIFFSGDKVTRRLSAANVTFDMRAPRIYNIGALRTFRIVLILYLSFQIYTFFAAGLSQSDSHWQESLAAAFETSTAYILVKNFVNAYRTMIFGLILVLVETRRLSLAAGIILAVFVCVVDVATSFNRIVILYLLVTCLVLARRFLVINLFVVLVCLPTVAWVSNAWTLFRGLALRDGFTTESFARAFEDTMRLGNFSARSFVQSINGIFESSNLVVFNFIVESRGAEVPVFWGYTFLLRPFTTFIPSTIWENKPRVFGTYLGEIINGIPGLALNSTIFGEVYTNFPVVWPIALLAAIGLFSKLYEIADRYVPGASAMAFFVGIALWRFDMNFASVGLYAIALIWIIQVFLSYTRRAL